VALSAKVIGDPSSVFRSLVPTQPPMVLSMEPGNRINLLQDAADSIVERLAGFEWNTLTAHTVHGERRDR
jgi:hypothetical protein